MAKFLKIVFILLILGFLTGSPGYTETVRIVAEDDWYPYSALREGAAEGIAVDITREAFKAEGIDVEFDVMNYDRGMLLVKDGLAIGCFDAPRTQEIEEIYRWHEEPLFIAKSFFYSTSDYPGEVKGVEDLTGKVLGLTQGYGYGDAIDMNNSIEKAYSKTDEIILKKLIAKRVDFILLYDRVADYLISRMGVEGQIKPVGLSESTGLYVAFSLKHPEGERYCDIFNRGFQKIKENGTYQRIFQDWDMKLKAPASAAQ
ncbi:MAG: transporter substrate-binding domain-containing protein [Candidatus Omnitrophota bacterium]